MIVKFQNKSDMTFNIKGYEFGVFLNGKYIATVKSSVEQNILPNGISDILVDVDITPKEQFTLEEITRLTIYAVSDRDKIIFTLDGKVTAKLGFVKMTLPVKFSYTLKELLADDPESTEKCNL